MLKVRHISISGLFDILTYRKCITRFTPTMIISNKFEVDITILYLVRPTDYSVLPLIRYVTL